MSKPLWTAEEAAEATGGRATCYFEAQNVILDSRQAKVGDLFVALQGEHADGHLYVTSALQQGASAALVEKIPEGLENAPLLVVNNCFEGLKKLAAHSRARSHAKIIAVTGSVGKTSTKEALKLAFEGLGKVHSSAGNFNNHYGVPLSLARMRRETEYGIFELGMNHKGEIAELSQQVRPDIALITTVEAVHLEFFASVEEIADAKAEIFLGMDQSGVAILNSDNPHYDRLARAARKQGVGSIYSFGSNMEAVCRLLDYEAADGVASVKADIAGKLVKYQLGILGVHQAKNSVAVLAAVEAAGGDIHKAAENLAEFKAPDGRGKLFSLSLAGGDKNITVMDDSYNASPASIRAALSVLGSYKGRQKIAILGDMRELGAQAKDLHESLEEAVIQQHIDGVITVGEQMVHLYRRLPASLRLGHFATIEALMPEVEALLHSGDIVLIKGSHGVGMYRLVAHIKTLETTNAI